MVILYIYSTCWRIKFMFYECQQGAGSLRYGEGGVGDLVIIRALAKRR
jgi:hypothetical protein